MSDEQGADEATDTDPEDDGSGLQTGDFVQLAYTARTVENGDLVDTTDQEVAEEADIDVEGQDFSPRTLVLGEGHLFESVEEDIEGKEVGDTGTVQVPAHEAFGEYDEEEVRTVSAEKIPEDERHPGAHVDIDGEHGHVETIIGGRARVDFNHPLAGQDVEYDYEVLDVVTEPVEQARGMLKMYFDVDLDMHIETDEVEEEVVVEPDEEETEDEEGEAEAEEEEGEDADDEEAEDDAAESEPAEPETELQTVEKETLYIESSPQLQFNQQWMMSKQQVLRDVMDKIGVDRVIIQEIIEGGGMPGMGGLGGMGGMGGGDLGDIEAQLEDADIDADEILEEIDDEDLELDE